MLALGLNVFDLKRQIYSGIDVHKFLDVLKKCGKGGESMREKTLVREATCESTAGKCRLRRTLEGLRQTEVGDRTGVLFR